MAMLFEKIVLWNSLLWNFHTYVMLCPNIIAVLQNVGITNSFIRE